MSEIPLQPRKWPKCPQNLKNDQNTIETLKVTRNGGDMIGGPNPPPAPHRTIPNLYP